MERHLTDRDRQNIAALYNDRFATHGRSVQTVGWGSTSDQILRFKMLLRSLDCKGKTILDFGCGLGDLIPYLDHITEGEFKYIGVDISQNLIDDARIRWKQYNAEFIVADGLNLKLPILPDITVESGALTLKIEDNESFARTIIQQLFELTQETLSLNFMSSYVDFQHEKNHHYNPEEIFKFCKSLCKWVSLYHDYPLWEFTIQMHKKPIY